MSKFPKINEVGYLNYSKCLDDYFNDYIPFRNVLVSLHNGLDYYLYNKSSDDRVIIGKDGWLFYSDVEDGDPLGSYEGTNLFTEEELLDISMNCIKNRDYLESQGKEFVILVVPNKERTYSEYMPDIYGKPSEEYRALQVVNYLKSHTNIRILYVYDELMRAKEVCPEYLYYKTNTHWNNIGAYVGSRTLCNELGIILPDITDVQLKIEDSNYVVGDLAKMLSIHNFTKKTDKKITIYGYDRHNVEEEYWDFQTYFQYSANNADDRSLYMIRDSFASDMSEYIGSQFRRSYFIYRPKFSVQNLQEFDPDIVVYETVERYISVLRSFKIYE